MFDIRSAFAALRRSASPETSYERGLAALAAGRHEAALAEFERALGETAAPPAVAKIQNKRGVVSIALGHRAAALEAFCAALAADERCAPALVNIGNVLLEDGDLLDAVDYYEAATRADERYYLAYRNLGAALRRLGRRPEAVRALRSAARLEARQPPARA